MTRSSDYKVPDNPEDDVDPQTEASKRYRKTAKGRAAVKKDGASASHIQAQLKYSKSTKGKEAVARWRNSDKGRTYAKELGEKKARVLLMLRREEQGLCALCESPDHAMDFHLKGTQRG